MIGKIEIYKAAIALYARWSTELNPDISSHDLMLSAVADARELAGLVEESEPISPSQEVRENLSRLEKRLGHYPDDPPF